ANTRVLEIAATTDEYAGMGTTVVAALVGDDHVTVAHVGDSRLYIGRDGKLRQLTRDDSWVATMLATNPETDPATLQHHPMRNALPNGGGSRPATDVPIVDEPLTGDELILLTTDGVHGAVDVRGLERIVERAPVDQLASALISAAMARGSQDNCTVVVAQV